MDPQFVRRRDSALEMLARKGVKPYTAAPPVYCGLWRLGVEIPPPHFASTTANLASFGIGFGALFALFKLWQQHFDHGAISWTRLSLTVGLTSVLFGWFLAIYYSRNARRLGLPRFTEIPADPAER